MQLLKRVHEKKLQDIEQTFSVEIGWIENTNQMNICPKKGLNNLIRLQEGCDAFIDLYQKFYPTIALEVVELSDTVNERLVKHLVSLPEANDPIIIKKADKNLVVCAEKNRIRGGVQFLKEKLGLVSDSNSRRTRPGQGSPGQSTPVHNKTSRQGRYLPTQHVQQDQNLANQSFGSENSKVEAGRRERRNLAPIFIGNETAINATRGTNIGINSSEISKRGARPPGLILTQEGKALAKSLNIHGAGDQKSNVDETGKAKIAEDDLQYAKQVQNLANQTFFSENSKVEAGRRERRNRAPIFIGNETAINATRGTNIGINSSEISKRGARPPGLILTQEGKALAKSLNIHGAGDQKSNVDETGKAKIAEDDLQYAKQVQNLANQTFFSENSKVQAGEAGDAGVAGEAGRRERRNLAHIFIGNETAVIATRGTNLGINSSEISNGGARPPGLILTQEGKTLAKSLNIHWAGDQKSNVDETGV